MSTKTRNAQNITNRNARASLRRDRKLAARIRYVLDRVQKVARRLYTEERERRKFERRVLAAIANLERAR